MRKCPVPNPGVLCCICGALIILALTLPASVWWFALGAALCGGGIIIIIRR